ncbi:MAG: hypothetical protein GXO20_08395 [Thermodesulfobacteria bacterium]|nr:hypothetical protein [Thermodesulfobacteriota bacterium]
MTDRERKRLEKILYYILGRRPDEFGLFLEDGFVKLKDLLKALNETEGYKDVRLKKLRDFFLIFKPERFEFLEEKNLVRVKKDIAPPEIYETIFVENPPRILYTPVKPRAWIKVSEEGLAAERIILSAEEELAARLARRRGAILIMVDTRKAMSEGAVFERYLEKLYLSSWIPAAALKGPPVDDEFRARYARKPKEKKEEPLPEESIPISEETVAYRKITRGRKKDPAWKKTRRKLRRR